MSTQADNKEQEVAKMENNNKNENQTIQARFFDLIYRIKRILSSRIYLEQVFSQLQEEFEVVKIKIGESSDKDKEYAKEVCEGILKNNEKGELSMADVKRFQWALVMLYDEATLRSKIPILIDDYKELYGKEEDDALLKDISGAKDEDKRAFISTLTAKSIQLHVDRCESFKKKTVLSVINMCWLIFFLISLFISVISEKNLFVVVFILGGLGGVVSTQRRIMLADASSERWLRDYSSGIYSYLNIFVSPIIGGVGALLILVFLKSNILSQVLGKESILFPIFPVCELKDSNIGVLRSCFLDGLPNNSSGLALLVLYSFLGGFSERFVPDLLDRLSNKVLTN